MATSKVKNLYQTRKVYNKQTGKMQRQKVKVGEKLTNTTKGSNIGLTGNAAKLRSQEIAANESVAKTRIGNRAATINEAIAGATATAMKALDRGRTQSSEIRQIQNTSQDSGVNQAINGGAQPAYNSRDDDEDADNPMIA